MKCQQTFVKKKKNWNSCARVFQFQNIYRMRTRRCLSVPNTKEKSKRFAGASIHLSGRHANYSHGAKQHSLLLHVFAVFGVVCGGNSNENENSAKSGISQDVTEITNISKNSFQVGHKSSKRFTLLLEFRTRHWRQWASDTHARVVVSKLYDVTNMQTKKTRAHFSRVSFDEIL